MVDRGSVDRYLQSQPQGRTRAWVEHTAWGAVALLSGRDAEWLGATQASRLRAALRNVDGVDDLVTRMRERSAVHTFIGHSATSTRLREHIIPTDLGFIGMADAPAAHVDGYLAAKRLDAVVRSLGLRADTSGTIVLRAREFDLHEVRELVSTTTVAAIDAATSTDFRLRGVGRRALAEQLKTFRLHARPVGRWMT